MNFLNDQLFTYLFSPRKIYQENVIQLKKQSLPEIILFGWLCYSFYGFINISIVSFLSSGVLNSVFDGEFLVTLSLEYLLQYKLIVYLFSIFLFPLTRAILYFYISLTLGVLNVVNHEHKINVNPIFHVFYADFFYLIPFIGGTCRFFAALIYFYQSMRYGSRLGIVEICFIFFGPFLVLSFSSILLLLGLLSLASGVSS